MAYHTTDTVTKLPATVLMIPKSYIEGDYLYRCDFEEKYGYRPFKYSGISRSLFTIETAFNMGLYVLDDFENQVFLGTDADREQYLGGMLFELCVTLITTETAEALDKASASVKTKNADEYIDIINKPDAELTADQLAYKKAYEQSKQIDDIAAAVKKNSGTTGKKTLVHYR